MRYLLWGFVAFVVITFWGVGATPQTVLIVRHGEKPELAAESTTLEANVLSPRGYVRAYALAPYFVNTFGEPNAVFAQQPDGADESLRPLETCTPTALTMKMPWGKSAHVNTAYTVDQVDDMADHILNDDTYNGKTVVICWEHHHINKLASALGAPKEEVAKNWPDDVYDVTYVLHYKDSKLETFDKKPQQLLYGDSAKVPF